MQRVRGQALEYLERIEQHGPPVIEQILDEVHTRSVKTIRGPSQALGAVVALAAGIATAGTATTVIEAMAQAAISALSAQTAVGLMTHHGNVGRVLKDITSKESLKSLAVSIAAAGVMHGIGDEFGIARPTAEQVKILSAPQLLTQHLQYNLVNAGVSTTLNATIGGQNLGEAAKGSLKCAAASTVGGVGANLTGDAYDTGALDFIEHKIVHAGLGAIVGAIVSDDPLSGAAAGAGGAIVAETAAEVLSENTDLTPRKIADISHLAGASAAMFAGLNVDVAITTATNAVENNFLLTDYHRAKAGLEADGAMVVDEEAELMLRRSPSYERLTDTFYSETGTSIEEELSCWYKTRLGLERGEIAWTGASLSRAMGAYGLDGVGIVNRGLDLGVGGAVER